MAIREGCWDCAACNTKGIRGSLRSCTSCGRPRANDVRFYLPGGAPAVTGAAQLQEARAGADWYCEHCSSGNTNARTDCIQCGAPKGASKSHPVGGLPASTGPRPPQASCGPIAVVVGLVLLLLIGAFVSVVVRTGRSGVGGTIGAPAAEPEPTREATLRIASVSWQRSVDVEELRTFIEEGWSVPAGRRVVGQEPRVHHHDRVLDHYETRWRSQEVQVGTRQVVVGTRDLGNGYFEDITEDEPVYETRQESYQEPVYRDVAVEQPWYRCEVERLVVVRTDRASGEGEDRTPRWPEPALGPGQRAGLRREAFRMRLAEEGSQATYDHELPHDAWRTYEAGQRVSAVIAGYPGRERVTSISPPLPEPSPAAAVGSDAAPIGSPAAPGAP